MPARSAAASGRIIACEHDPAGSPVVPPYVAFGSWLCRNARRFFVEAGVHASSAVFGGCWPIFRIFGVWAVLAGSGALEQRFVLEVA